jgi:hypothetical protein
VQSVVRGRGRLVYSVGDRLCAGVWYVVGCVESCVFAMGWCVCGWCAVGWCAVGVCSRLRAVDWRAVVLRVVDWYAIRCVESNGMQAVGVVSASD